MNEILTEQEVRNRYQYQPSAKEKLSTKIANACKCDSSSLKKFVFGFFPVLTWLPNYSVKSDLPGDVIGGVTTAIVRIPQSLAYALLAGVDPINGMYTAFFAPLIYSFLGTSSHISVGTFAVISLMLGSALEKFLLANPFVPSNSTVSSIATVTDVTHTFSTTAAENILDKDPEEAAYRMAIVGSITLLVGLLQVLLGICNLGFVAIFLSDPLISGFTTGAAVYVFSAQVKYFFGIDLGRKSAPFALAKMYIELFSRLGETKPAEVIISVLTIVLLYPIKLINVKYKKQLRSIPIPMELIIVIIATIVSFNVDLVELYDVEIVGKIPSGLPQPSFPRIDYWPSVISDAFSIAIVSFAITVSIGKLFAKKHGYKIAPNQELFALGVSQFSCALFQGHACSGSLARSSVKESSGTRTQFSDVVSCIVMLLVLLFVGPLLEPLPVACLSSIIMVNVRTLFHQFLRLPYFWKTCKYDFVIWIISFVSTVMLGVDFGLIVGVVCLLASIVLRKYNASTTVSGQLGASSLYGNVDRFGNSCEIEGLKIIRFPESPFFGNKESLETVCAEVLFAIKRHNDRGKVTSRPKQTDQISEQSRGLLEDESSESDSGVDERQLGKYSENSKKDSADDYIVSVNSSTGAVHFENQTKSSSNIQLASSSRSTISQISVHSDLLIRPGHYFNTVIFDCTGWTFIDTMGIETLKQICLEFKSVDLRVFFAGLPSKVFDKLSDAELFGEDYCAVAYPSLSAAVKVATTTLTTNAATSTATTPATPAIESSTG